MDARNMIPSARGAASHRPASPQNRGRSKIPPPSRTKVRKKERRADTFPLERAVNIAEVKIFRPQNKKLYEKTEKPSAAIS